MPKHFLQLLGPPELRDAEGNPVQFRTRKQLGVLVYMALEARQRGVPRERLVELFWPHVPYEKGRHSLSQSLTAIRHVLGRDAIELGSRNLRLAIPLDTDLDRPAAVSTNGIESPRPLDGMEGAGGVEFEYWLDALRQRMLSTIRRALTAEIQALRSDGQTGLVKERAVQLYRIDPSSEVAVLAIAHQDVADGHADETVTLLEDYLHRAPNADAHPDVQRLLNRVKSNSHSAAQFGSSPHLAMANQPEVFVGREAELRAVRAEWDRACEGTLRTCAIMGPAGIGKSALGLRLARAVAASGDVMLAVSCQQGAKDIPFAALSDLITNLSRDPDLGATDPHWLAEASRIAPILRTKYPGIPDPQPVQGETTRFAIAEAFAQMIQAVAEQSAVLIFLDDVQNLDPASREVLHMLSRRLRQFRALILGAQRTRGSGQSSTDDSPSSTFEWDSTVRLRPLEATEARGMAIQLTDSLTASRNYEAVLETITDVTGGHPYFIQITTADWVTNGQRSFAAILHRDGTAAGKWAPSDAMHAAFERHHRGLSEDARNILEIAAIAARAVTAEDIADLAGLDAVRVNGALLEALAARILTTEGDAVRFKNELHRAYIYNAARDDFRVYQHARIARSLMRGDNESKAQALLEASHHFGRAGMRAAALDTAARGANTSIREGAPKEATEALLVALDGSDAAKEPEAVLLLAEGLNLQAAFAHSVKWLDEIDESGSDDQVATALRLRAEAMVRGPLGTDHQIRRAVHRSLAHSRRTANELALAKALMAAAELAIDTHDMETLRSIKEDCDQLARTAPELDTIATAQLASAYCLHGAGRWGDAYQVYNVCARAFQHSGSYRGLIKSLNGCGMAARGVGDLRRSRQACERALKLARRHGDHELIISITNNHGVCLTDYCLLAEADSLYEQSAAALKLLPGNRREALVFNNIAELRLLQGDFRSATTWLDRANQAAEMTGLSSHLAMVMITRADLEIATGSPQAALKLINAAEALTAPAGSMDSASPNVFDNSNFPRAMRFRQWMGGNAEAALASPFQSHDFAPDLGTFIEIVGFVEWAREQNGHPTSEPLKAGQMIEASGMYGIALHLDVLKMLPASARRALVRAKALSTHVDRCRSI